MAIKKILEFDGIGSVANFTVGSSAIVAGFVEISASADWTLGQSVGSSTTKPLGISTGSAAALSTGCEVRDKGYVWLVGQDAMNASDPVFPSSVAGRIVKTGAVDGSGNARFLGGFGTVIKGAAASGNVLFKIQGLA